MIERYATCNAWAEYFERREGVRISHMTIRDKLKKAEMVGKDGLSKIGQFFKGAYFSEQDVRQACGDSLSQLPQGNTDGFFWIDGARYASITTFSHLFKVDYQTIIFRLRKTAFHPIEGKGLDGKIMKIYAESVILELLGDMLDLGLVKIRKGGLADVGGVNYGTIGAVAHLLGVSPTTVSLRLATSGLTPLKGRGKNGKSSDLFPVPAVRELLADLLDPTLVQVGDDGFAMINKIRHGTRVFIANLLGISEPTVSSYLASSGIVPMKGKDKAGHPADLFPVPAVRELLNHLLDPDLPVCGPDGLVEIFGVRHGTIYALSHSLGISETAINSRIEKWRCPSLCGKNRSGQVFRLYPEPAILELCADLLDPTLVQVGDDGFAMINKIRHGTIPSLSRILGVAQGTIKKRLISLGLPPVKGKDKIGHPGNLYPEPAVRELCKDLIEKKASAKGGYTSGGKKPNPESK